MHASLRLIAAVTFCAPFLSGQFPNAPGKDVAEKICNTCHGPEVTTGKGRTRQQWGEVIANMVTRGAKGSDQELTEVLDYLAKNVGPQVASTATAALPRKPSAGPADVHVVDVAAADRGKTVYIAECITCHGQRARGKDDNPDLVRSVVVLHDRYSSTIAPFLKKGHPLQSGRPSANLTVKEVGDLSNFLHQRVADTLRSGPYSKVIDVLTGNAQAGKDYFDATCASCHSATKDLAGIGTKYDPSVLQQRFLFPRSGGFVRGSRTAPTTVTVTVGSAAPLNGNLDKVDDFNVSLRDSSGQYHSFERGPNVKVEIHDPYETHNQLLDKYTDRNMHDVVAYLATLK